MFVVGRCLTYSDCFFLQTFPSPFHILRGILYFLGGFLYFLGEKTIGAIFVFFKGKKVLREFLSFFRGIFVFLGDFNMID